jgi:adenylyltransferase/sulfurtransferase
MDEIDRLRREIALRETELADLKSQLALAEVERRDEQPDAAETASASAWRWPLTEDEYLRYSRQMIVPNFGLQGK